MKDTLVKGLDRLINQKFILEGKLHFIIPMPLGVQSSEQTLWPEKAISHQFLKALSHQV